MDSKADSVPIHTLPIRKCGSCSECCFLFDVEAIEKPIYSLCPNIETKDSGCCSINDTKPEACKQFTCSWIGGIGRTGDRPDKLGIIPVLWKDKQMLALYEVRAGAWHTEAAKVWFKAIKKLVNLEPFDVDLVLVRFQSPEVENLGVFPIGAPLKTK